MKKIVLITFLFSVNTVLSQQSDTSKINNTIAQLFYCLKNGDSLQINELFAENARLSTVYFHPKKGTKIIETPLQEFKSAIGTPHKEKWEERYNNVSIQIDGALAHVWMNYSFHIDNQRSHCGVNALTMIRENGVWKIYDIIDTRHRENCD